MEVTPVNGTNGNVAKIRAFGAELSVNGILTVLGALLGVVVVGGGWLIYTIAIEQTKVGIKGITRLETAIERQTDAINLLVCVTGRDEATALVEFCKQLYPSTPRPKPLGVRGQGAKTSLLTVDDHPRPNADLWSARHT